MPRINIYPLVALSPFLFSTYLLRFTVLGIPFTVLEVFTYFLFLFWLWDWFLSKKKLILKSFYFVAVGLFLAGALFGVFLAPSEVLLPSGEVFLAKRAALGVFKGWVFAPLLYFWVLTQVLSKPKEIQKLLHSFVYSAVLVSILAQGFAIFGEGLTHDFRLRGFYESANYLALYLLPAVILNGLWLWNRTDFSLLQRRLNTATFAVLLYALFFSQSYAAILALFGSFVLFGFYLLISHPSYRKKVVGILAILAAGFLILVGTQWQSPKFQQFLDFENRSSTTVRLQVYEVAWDLASDNWFLGVGPGLFQPHYQNRAVERFEGPPMEWNMPHSHNIFLGFWLNAGLLGLVALLLIIGLAHGHFTYPLVALWGILLHGFFDMPFWKNDLAMIFWLIVASILILQKHGTASAKNPQA